MIHLNQRPCTLFSVDDGCRGIFVKYAPRQGAMVLICVQVIAFAVVRYDITAVQKKGKKKKLLREQVNFKKKDK